MAKRNETATINYLRTVAIAGDSKYMRNGRKWYNSVDWSPSETTSLSPLGWWFQDLSDFEDAGATPKINASKSAIDTKDSKIANQKVRPCFTPRKGTYTTRKIVKQVQNYFDHLFYHHHVGAAINDASRLGDIFDIGWVFVDPVAITVRALAPFQVGIVRNEWQYSGWGTKLLVSWRDFPCTQLSQFNLPNDDTKTFCLFEMFFDTETHIIVLLKDKKELRRIRWTGTRVPIVPLYNNTPLLGFRTSSLLDDLLPLQHQLDINITKIKDAAMSTMANTIFVPDGSDLKVKSLDAGAGNVVRYRPTPGISGSPIEVATPTPIHDFYLEWHDRLKDAIYEMAGVDEFAVQSDKPAGLNSGVAIQTMEDKESSRFQEVMDRVIHAYVQVAELFIDSFDDDKLVIADVPFESDITWKQVREEIQHLNIQFTAASNISNDPQKQLETLQTMSQMGIIEPARVGELMQLPDEQSAYDDSSAIIDGVEEVIFNAIFEDVYKVPIFVDYETLANRIPLYQNKLYVVGGKEEEIARLQKLYLIVEDLLKKQQPVDSATTQLLQAQEQETGGGSGDGSGLKVADPSMGFAAAQTPDIVKGPTSGNIPERGTGMGKQPLSNGEPTGGEV